jgi:hypothetical protein
VVAYRGELVRLRESRAAAYLCPSRRDPTPFMMQRLTSPSTSKGHFRDSVRVRHHARGAVSRRLAGTGADPSARGVFGRVGTSLLLSFPPPPVRSSFENRTVLNMRDHNMNFVVCCVLVSHKNSKPFLVLHLFTITSKSGYRIL